LRPDFAVDLYAVRDLKRPDSRERFVSEPTVNVCAGKPEQFLKEFYTRLDVAGVVYENMIAEGFQRVFSCLAVLREFVPAIVPHT
jgi:hypothetical protein